MMKIFFHNGLFIKGDVKYRIGKFGEDWDLLNVDYGNLVFYNREYISSININSTCNALKDYNIVLLSDSLLNECKRWNQGEDTHNTYGCLFACSNDCK